jgi:hypothetical protein
LRFDELAGGALAQTTLIQYENAYKRWSKWCRTQQPPFLEDSDGFKAYLAHFYSAKTGTLVHYASQIQQHLGTTLVDPAELHDFFRGFGREARERGDTAPGQNRYGIRAEWALNALLAATELCRTATERALTRDETLLLRSHTYVAFGFAFHLRADSQFYIKWADVTVTGGSDVSVALVKEKGRGHTGIRSVVRDNAYLNGLLPAFLHAYKRAMPPGAFLFLLPGEESRPNQSGALLGTAWVTQSLSKLGVRAASLETISAHSVRIGATSAAAAVGVTGEVLCALGLWAGKAPPTYIRPVACDDAARFFFGSLTGRNVATPTQLQSFLSGISWSS